MQSTLFGLALSLLAATAAAEGRPAASTPARTEAAPSGVQFQFTVLGDPQIGYGPGAELADHRRFEQVVDAVNASAADVAVIVGDLVQDRTYLQRWLFERVRTQLRPKTLLVAGNHDVVDEDSLAAYRDDHGPDYYDYVHESTTFIVLDSETARDHSISVQEYAAQWAFIEKSLDAHLQSGRAHAVLAMHRPPFVESEDEPESAQNWPPDSRAQLLALARRARVMWIVAGHLHRRHEVKTTDGISIIVAQGSAKSFDDSPIGYRRFDVQPSSIASQWVSIAPGPAAAWHVPGFREWTPRLVDFSVRHWALTLLYAAGATAALRTARSVRGRRLGEPRAWRAMSMALFFFAANMQLDLDELIQETARISARIVGIQAIRHLVSATLLGLGMLLALVWLARNFQTARRSRSVLLATASLSIPATWFALSVISHHDIGMVLSEDLWDLLTLSCVATVMLCARQATQSAKAEHAT